MTDATTTNSNQVGARGTVGDADLPTPSRHLPAGVLNRAGQHGPRW